MKRIILLAITLLFCSTCFALESSDVSSGLSLEECLSIALENHPSLRKSKAATHIASALLDQTKAANRWKVSLTGRTSYNGDYDDWDNRYHSETLGLDASKLLYDTGVNRLNREINKEDINASLENERYTLIAVAAGVKKAYYDLVLKILGLIKKR